MKSTFSKKEKLKGQILIDRLFKDGHSVSVYPLRAIFMPADFNDGVILKTGVSVSKRNFKKAFKRNQIKRLMRESYRLNKKRYFNNITTQCALMILYIGKEEPSFNTLDGAMKQLLGKLAALISK